MRTSVRFNKRGFTLVELMIVVAIISILAALAIVGVSKYVKSSKTTEARNVLGQIGKNAMAAFSREKALPGFALTIGGATPMTRAECVSATASVPATMAPVQGSKYQSTKAEWQVDALNTAGFACLNFQMTEPQHYEYMYTSDATPTTQGTKCTATANGDLDGDGVFSTFMLFGIVSNNLLAISPNLGEVNPDQ